MRLFSAKHEFPNEWHRFLQPQDTDDKQVKYYLQLELALEWFLFRFRGKTITINKVKLFFKLKGGFAFGDQPLSFSLTRGDTAEPLQFQTSGSPIAGLPFAAPSDAPSEMPSTWALEVQESALPNPAAASESTWWQEVTIDGATRTHLRPEAIENIWVVCQYSAKKKQGGRSYQRRQDLGG